MPTRISHFVPATPNGSAWLTCRSNRPSIPERAIGVGAAERGVDPVDHVEAGGGFGDVGVHRRRKVVDAFGLGPHHARKHSPISALREFQFVRAIRVIDRAAHAGARGAADAERPPVRVEGADVGHVVVADRLGPALRRHAEQRQQLVVDILMEAADPDDVGAVEFPFRLDFDQPRAFGAHLGHRRTARRCVRAEARGPSPRAAGTPRRRGQSSAAPRTPRRACAQRVLRSARVSG